MKTSIFVPEPLFHAGERLAQALQVSRSQLYSDALAAYLTSRSVTARLDAIYVSTESSLDPAVASAQLGSIGRTKW